MPAVEIDDLYCRDCGNRGLLIADQFGHCIVCAGHNIVSWAGMRPEERAKIERELGDDSDWPEGGCLGQD